MPLFSVAIPGEPVPWAAKSTNRKTGNRFIAARQSEAIGRALDAIERRGFEQIPSGVPLRMEAEFYVARRKGHYGTGRNADLLKPSAPKAPTGRPDLSNLVKLVEDCLTLAGVVVDDDQIVEAVGRKRYAELGDVPHSTVRLFAA